MHQIWCIRGETDRRRASVLFESDARKSIGAHHRGKKRLHGNVHGTAPNANIISDRWHPIHRTFAQNPLGHHAHKRVVCVDSSVCLFERIRIRRRYGNTTLLPTLVDRNLSRLGFSRVSNRMDSVIGFLSRRCGKRSDWVCTYIYYVVVLLLVLVRCGKLKHSWIIFVVSMLLSQ